MLEERCRDPKKLLDALCKLHPQAQVSFPDHAQLTRVDLGNGLAVLIRDDGAVTAEGGQGAAGVLEDVRALIGEINALEED